MMDEREERRKDAMARTSFRHVPDVDSTVATLRETMLQKMPVAYAYSNDAKLGYEQAVNDWAPEIERLRTSLAVCEKMLASETNLVKELRLAIFERDHGPGKCDCHTASGSTR